MSRPKRMASCHPDRPHRCKGLCAKCYEQQHTAPYRKAHPQTRHAAHIRRKFGLSPEEYSTMLKAQAGVCAICGNVCPTGRALAVDHNHTTGQIRGLLCSTCNPGLGYFRDNPKLLEEAANYILKHDREWQKPNTPTP